MQTLLPEGWKAPIGYANGIKIPASGHLILVAGQVGWTADQIFESEDLSDHFAQALENVLDVVTQGGGKPADICRITAFCTDKDAYLASRRELGAIWRRLIGNHYPAMSMIFVADLLDHPGKIELEATAVVPDRP